MKAIYLFFLLSFLTIANEVVSQADDETTITIKVEEDVATDSDKKTTPAKEGLENEKKEKKTNWVLIVVAVAALAFLTLLGISLTIAAFTMKNQKTAVDSNEEADVDQAPTFDKEPTKPVALPPEKSTRSTVPSMASKSDTGTIRSYMSSLSPGAKSNLSTRTLSSKSPTSPSRTKTKSVPRTPRIPSDTETKSVPRTPRISSDTESVKSTGFEPTMAIDSKTSTTSTGSTASSLRREAMFDLQAATKK